MKRLTKLELDELYRAGGALSRRTRQEVGLRMPIDVFVPDPTGAEQGGAAALSQVYVDLEPDLMDGPTSARIAVVDRDADTGRLHEPARWDARHRRFVLDYKGRPEPITREHCALPQFHQVNVWAIIQSALDSFEGTTVLGRSVPWAFEGNRLIVMPHARQQFDTAFYQRSSKSMQFGYFDADGERVYTCLHPDIILHRTGHAILDGLRPLYFENSSVQTTAFHEFMAELTAILFSLYNSPLRQVFPQEPEGHPTRDPIAASLAIESSLAEEFARYAADRPYLRSAENTFTIDDVRNSSSPYGWAKVLIGAMFDIFAGTVAHYVQKELDTGRKPTTKQALIWALNRFRCTALQPVDYLPPVDVQFADYARAVLRASEVADPLDKGGYRDLIRACFDKRGIDYSAEEEAPDRFRFYTYDIEQVSRSRTDAYHFLHENRRQLCIPPEQDISVIDLYETDKMLPDGRRLPREWVIQYAWREDVHLQGADFGFREGTTESLLCGGTLVLDGRGNLLSCTRKPGTGRQESSRLPLRRYCQRERAKGEQRRQALLDYIKEQLGLGLDPVEQDG